MILSDDLGQVSLERLRIAQVLLPPIDQQPQILDWFDSTRPECLRLDLHNSCGEWHLLAYFNWADQAVDLDLDLSTFGLDTTGVIWCCEFWSSHYRFIRDGHWKQPGVQPHGTVLLAARSITDSSAQYLGSSFHISQGLEVSQWSHKAWGSLNLNLSDQEKHRANSYYGSLQSQTQPMEMGNRWTGAR